VTRAEMNRLALHPYEFHGEWNYELRPIEVDYSISIKGLSLCSHDYSSNDGC